MTPLLNSAVPGLSSRWLRSQSVWGIGLGVVVIVAWFLWQYWGRAQLIAMLLGGAAGVAVIWSYPVVGAMLSAFILTGNITEFAPGVFTPLVALSIGVVLIRKLLQGNLSWTVDSFSKWALLLAIWYAVSPLWAESYRFYDPIALVRAMLVLLLFAEVVRTPRDYLAVLVAAGAGAIFTGAMTIQSAVEFYTTGAAETLSTKVGYIEQTRFYGVWSEPNMMALSQVPVIGLSFAALRARLSIWIRLYSGLVAAVGIGTVVMSLSRGAGLSLIIMLLAIAASDRLRLRILGGSAILITIVLMILPIDVIGRFATLAKPGSDRSINERSHLITAGLRVFEESFPLGVGAGNYRNHSADYVASLPTGLISHNGYVEVASESGLVGVLLFIGLLASLGSTISWRGSPLMGTSLAGNMNACARAAFLALLMSLITFNGTWFSVFWMYLALISARPRVFSMDQVGGGHAAPSR